MGLVCYGVKEGRRPGVYFNWPDCKNEIEDHLGAVYKKCISYDEAAEFVYGDIGQVPVAYIDSIKMDGGRKVGYGLVVVREKTVVHVSHDSIQCNITRAPAELLGEVIGAMSAILQAESLGYKAMQLVHKSDEIREWYEGHIASPTALSTEYYNFARRHKNDVNIHFRKELKGVNTAKYIELANSVAKLTINT